MSAPSLSAIQDPAAGSGPSVASPTTVRGCHFMIGITGARMLWDAQQLVTV